MRSQLVGLLISSALFACGDSATSGDVAADTLSDAADVPAETQVADVPGDTAPDTAEPDTTEPDTAAPDTPAPDTAEPDTAEPDTTAPDTTEPEVIDDTVEPADVSETVEPDVADTSEVDASPPVPIGGACATPEDCGPYTIGAAYCFPPDAYWSDGYCISYYCANDAACDAGAHCGAYDRAGNGLCLASCASDADCIRAHYSCWDVDRDGQDECGPTADGGGALGDPCDDIGDCAGGAGTLCNIIPPATEGVCAANCSGDTCPAGWHCGGRGADGSGACLPSCDGDGDCHGGTVCGDRDRNGIGECGEPGTGAVGVGDSCAATPECGLGPDSVCLLGANFSGACSAVCAGDAECPAGSQCVGANGPAAGFCLETCDADEQCLVGAGCVDFDGDLRSECGPDAQGFQTIGRSCQVASDCAGGDGWFCGYPDLVCKRFCVDDAECGPGGHCLVTSGFGLCVADCVNKTDCDVDMICVDRDGDARLECALTGHGETPVGGPCAGDAGCRVGFLCDGLGPLGLCTRGCDAPADCPAGSRCGGLIEDDVNDLCLATCAADDDCRVGDGWRCFDGDGDGETECRPFAGGSAPIGANCATTADCAGGQGAFCYEGAGAWTGICTRRCTEAADCAAGAACVALPSYPASKLCIADCSAECRSDWQCVEVDPAVPTEVCLDGCASDADCRLDLRHPVCDLTRGVCVE